MDAEHGPEVKLAIHEAQENFNSFKMLFWAPISIRGHTVLVASTPGTWRATNANNLPMNGIQIRMTSDLWNEWPSHQTFLKWGSSMNGGGALSRHQTPYVRAGQSRYGVCQSTSSADGFP